MQGEERLPCADWSAEGKNRLLYDDFLQNLQTVLLHERRDRHFVVPTFIICGKCRLVNGQSHGYQSHGHDVAKKRFPRSPKYFPATNPPIPLVQEERRFFHKTKSYSRMATIQFQRKKESRHHRQIFLFFGSRPKCRALCRAQPNLKISP